MRVLITAGPTWERIDAVRFLGNRSSGRMGLALAQAAAAVGHQVTLLLGPGVDSSAVVPQTTCLRFESCADLLAMLETHWPNHDLLIMAAAVSDYRPKSPAKDKWPRQDQAMHLELEPTPDLVAAMAGRRQPGQRIVAFALEQADQLETRARQKLLRKQVDAIVANPLETMNAPDIHALLLWKDGQIARPGPMPKPQFAQWLIQQIT